MDMYYMYRLDDDHISFNNIIYLILMFCLILYQRDNKIHNAVFIPFHVFISRTNIWKVIVSFHGQFYQFEGIDSIQCHMTYSSWWSSLDCYRNWYQDWGHCGVTNDLGSSPQPEGEARGLWWASQVVGDTTMTEIEVSISILSWCPKVY